MDMPLSFRPSLCIRAALVLLAMWCSASERIAHAESAKGIAYRLSQARGNVARDGIRDMYVEGFIRSCSTLGDAPAAEMAAVSAAELRDTRWVCMAVVSRLSSVCVDAYDPATCPSMDLAKIRAAVARIAPLSQSEEALFRSIPSPFWRRLAAMQRARSGRGTAREAQEGCVQAGSAQQPLAGVPPHFVTRVRTLCAGVAEAFAVECVGKGAMASCDGRWDIWPSMREAMVRMRASAAELEPFDRILSSPERADHAIHVQYTAILRERGERTIDTCTAVTRLRDLLGPPTPELEARVNAAKQSKQPQTRELERLGTYLWSVDQLYQSAVSVLDDPVEQTPLKNAEQAVADLSCIPGYRDTDAQLQKARQLVADVRAFQEKEAACMADPKCRAERIAKDICAAMADKRQIERDIAREHRYARKAGVVELAKLAELKRGLEMTDDEIAAKKAQYRELTERPFRGKCK